MITIEATGKTIEEALKSGLEQLQKEEKEVVMEVITEPSSGIFGFGKKEAKIRLTVKEPVEAVVTSAATEEMTEAEKTDDSVETKADKEENRLSAEEVAADGKAFLQEVLDKMGIPVMIEKMIKEERIIFHLRGNDLGVLIGKHGQTLDALQYLVNLKANKGKESRFFIMLDVENYRARREETLKALAHRLASRVKHSHNKVILEPMNGYERKIIHLALQHMEHIRTESEGQDPYRHVVIYYK